MKKKLDQVFNPRSGCMYAMCLCSCEAKRPNLELKMWHKQLLDFIPLGFTVPDPSLALKCKTRVEVKSLKVQVNLNP